MSVSRKIICKRGSDTKYSEHKIFLDLFQIFIAGKQIKHKQEIYFSYIHCNYCFLLDTASFAMGIFEQYRITHTAENVKEKNSINDNPNLASEPHM